MSNTNTGSGEMVKKACIYSNKNIPLFLISLTN